MREFQASLVRLVAEPDFRDAVRLDGAAALPEGLSALERVRLIAIASDPGMDVNRMLHKGFRLGKLRAMLPLTCRLLGAKALARQIEAFWSRCPPSSFYFLPEALAFCRHLQASGLRRRYLDEVLAYEQAALELERARRGLPPPQVVRFRHDPSMLLGALAAGRVPRRVPLRPCAVVGRRDAEGQVRWALIDDELTPGAPQRPGPPGDARRRPDASAASAAPSGSRAPAARARTGASSA